VSLTVQAGGPIAFDVPELGAQLGVKGAAIRHTLDRLVRFGLAYQWSLTTFAVNTKAPRLSTHQLRQLPEVLQRAHADHARRDVAAAAEAVMA
jgi:DNA-binding IclR family transcriptional regulator